MKLAEFHSECISECPLIPLGCDWLTCWWDDFVFEKYPTWEDCEQAGIFNGLLLEKYFGTIDNEWPVADLFPYQITKLYLPYFEPKSRRAQKIYAAHKKISINIAIICI